MRKLSALYGAVVAAAIMVALFSLATIVIIIKCVSWKPEVYVSNQFIEKTPEQLPLRSKFLLLDPVWCYLYCRNISTISLKSIFVSCESIFVFCEFNILDVIVSYASLRQAYKNIIYTFGSFRVCLF